MTTKEASTGKSLTFVVAKSLNLKSQLSYDFLILKFYLH